MLENLFDFLQVYLERFNRIVIWLILDVRELGFARNFDEVY